MAQNSNENGFNLNEVVPIALAAWGTIYLISGLRNLGIKAALKTIVGGWLLYKGVNGYYNSSAGLDEDAYFNEEEPFVIGETETLIVTQDPTIE